MRLHSEQFVNLSMNKKPILEVFGFLYFTNLLLRSVMLFQASEWSAED